MTDTTTITAELRVPFYPVLNHDPYLDSLGGDWRTPGGEPYYGVRLSEDTADTLGLQRLNCTPTDYAYIRAAAVEVKDGALIATNSEGVVTLVLAAGTWLTVTACESLGLFDASRVDQ